MNLLRMNGHPYANLYPLARVWTEVHMTRRHIRQKVAIDTIALNTVIVAALSGKDAKLKKFVEDMNDG